MKLVEETSSILREVMPPFDFENPVMDPYELSDGLQKLRKEENGIGLAAPQVGINARVFVIGMGNFETEGADDYNRIFFNPVLELTDGDDVYMLEGCLSFPGLFVKVKRPENIQLKYYTEEGTEVSERFVGMTSRIIQHELDHLDGITYIRRANRIHLEKAKKDRKISKRRQKRLDTTE
jgi:peptide deformylase